MLAAPDPDRLRDWHTLFCSEPHVAGTAGDGREIERLAGSFREMGLETEVHEFWPYLAYPVEAEVQVLDEHEDAPIVLSLYEDELDEDSYSGHPDLWPGWNSYSGSGEVTAEVVYANYGTEDDFERLAEMGVRVKGKIAICRYGRNFRGYKAKFAEAAGAAGLIIYADPDDSGYRRGLMYPEGGWANSSYIQRGSIKTLPWSGDPLTPFVEATEDAERLDLSDLELPVIPVQPMSWGAAQEILKRMKGQGVPGGWQGGLPFAYRVEGGAQLKVRLKVTQKREIRKTANVLGYLRGTKYPEELVIIGCHHDAWGFGAGDPNSGTILVYEAARAFAAAAKQGFRPARTIVFANWGAEEFGIIGSTEWVEKNRQLLMEHGVAYINLDMATMGPNFGSSAAPMLKTLIEEVARVVPQATPGNPDSGVMVAEKWGDKDSGGKRFGNLGGGSDHVGFYCHAGVSSCGLGAHGSAGTSYHSNYDNLHWYRQVVGNDYEPAQMLTRMVVMMATRLANGEVLPLDGVRYGADLREHLAGMGERAQGLGIELDMTEVLGQVDAFEREAREMQSGVLKGLAADTLSEGQLERVNGILKGLERAWIRGEGIRNRPWFRNLYAATDPHSGYAAWVLPGLRGAVEEGMREEAREELREIGRVVEAMGEEVTGGR